MTTTVRDAATNTPAKVTVSETVAQLIEGQRAQIARALPLNMDPDRFARVAVTVCKQTPALLGAEPLSLMGALMQSAQLGLEPGPLGHAYLVPFRNSRTGKTEVQFIIGYKGIIDLARRSGQILSIVARPVHANDAFTFQYGTEESLTHVPADGDRGPVVRYYGVALFRDGGVLVHVMTKADVDVYRARSKAKDNGPWVTDYDAMACKTVIRRMAPFLPLTIEGARALADADDRVLRLDDDGDIIDVGEATMAAPEPDEAD